LRKGKRVIDLNEGIEVAVAKGMYSRSMGIVGCCQEEVDEVAIGESEIEISGR